MFGPKRTRPVAEATTRRGRLEGKTCLVTGSAKGIGRGIAEMFAEEGANVVVADLDGATTQALAVEMTGRGLSAFPMEHDAGDEGQWRRVLDETVKHFGRFDVLVNNAASGWASSLEQTSLDNWRQINRVTNDGVFIGCKLALASMSDQGAIINIASIAGIKGSSSTIAYAAAKGAVIVFTRSLAMICAKQGKQIRVNAIAPGLIDTDGLQGVIRSFTKGNVLLEPAVRTKMSQSVPLGYLGAPSDIAHAAVYLASDAARYVTGQILAVDGGFTAS